MGHHLNLRRGRYRLVVRGGVVSDLNELLYPIVIVQDRFFGQYSGGGWLAIAGADLEIRTGVTRAAYVLEDGPNSEEDTDAMAFWWDSFDWIAAGNTPEEARALLFRMHQHRLTC